MTQSTAPPAASRRSRSRFIHNADAAPTFEVLASFAETRRTNNPAKVSVRCGPCDKRLWDVEEGLVFDEEYERMVEDGTLLVIRRCRSCGMDNACRVSGQSGTLYAGPDAVSGPWHCVNCDRSLGKVDAVRGRITVTCACGQETRIKATDAMGAA